MNQFKILPQEQCFIQPCATCEAYVNNALRGINKECPQLTLKQEYKKQCVNEMLEDAFKIGMELITTLKKGDKVNVSWINKSGDIVVKRCTFHEVDGNFLIVKPPRAKKKAWEIPLDSKVKVEKCK